MQGVISDHIVVCVVGGFDHIKALDTVSGVEKLIFFRVVDDEVVNNGGVDIFG